MPRRQVYLAVFSNGSKPAHWSIFIKGTGTGTKGTLIHVVGNPATGYFLEFKRNYNFANTRTRHQIISLGDVDSTQVRETTGNGVMTIETTAKDQLEMRASGIRPPGRTANPFDPAALNCQDWIAEYVKELVDNRIINQSARDVLANAPKRI